MADDAMWRPDDCGGAGGGGRTLARPRYRLVGYLHGQFGLAVAARNTAQVLAASGRAVDRVAIDEDPLRPAPAARGDVNLFHLNPFDLARSARRWRPAIDPGAPSVCVPFWEMPLLPRDWRPALEAMHLLLAPSRFIEEACARALGPDRVLHYPQAVFLPEGIAPDRARWGLRDDATIFVVAFDPGSDLARKNPWAALDAFGRAFPGTRDAQLVVKARPWPGVRAIEAELRSLHARAAGDPRIRIVDETLSYRDLLSLYASCDVMLSLHRSEGLGLHLMEAMSLGKVVVATGWSGNTDFTTAENSVAVPYRLVPVAPRHWSYLAEIGRPGQVWAEPDADAAAEAMARLHEDPALRRSIGGAAARDMELRRREVLSGGTFGALEERLASSRGASRRSLASAVRRTNVADWMARARAAWHIARSSVTRR
jgi:glycosyltransferase involved in cell wall biosynthesis